MATRQASQSNAMLYAVVTFVALFLIAATFAVIYYVKSEEFRTQAEMAREDLQSIATPTENNALTRIVGKPTAGQSYLATMQAIVNDLYSLILGQQPPENMPATAKFNEISMKITALNENVLGEDVNPAIGPDGVALLKAVEDMKQKLDNERANQATLKEINQNLQTDLQDATEQNEQARQNYVAELNQFQQEIDSIRNRFEEMQSEMAESTDEQLQAFQARVEAEQDKLRQKQLDLQQTEGKLSESDTLLQDALTKLKAIKPDPEKEVQAYQPDAQIMRVDLKNGIVYLDAGINDRVYRGLTFAIYDRNRPIPEDGEGKAEIEIFQVADRVSAARIVKSDKTDPIVKDDIVANLIWDRDGTNLFVVAGAFDYNNDGRVEPDGDKRIIELIERWGGQITNEITVDVDFLIIGEQPEPLPRPTQVDLDTDPMIQQRYEVSLNQARTYKEMLEKAVKLGIPVFNQKRFLYLIGYDTLANKNPML
jgi:hypothetical protein